MYWNYRVIKSNVPVQDEDKVYEVYALHEVYYDNDGYPGSWTLNPITLDNYDDSEDMKDSITLMMDAFKKPVLLLTEDTEGNECLIEIDTPTTTGDVI